MIANYLNRSTPYDGLINVGDKVQPCNCGIESGNLLSWSVQTTYEPISGSNTEGNDNWYGLHRVS